MILSIRDHPTLYSKARTFQALGTLSMMSPKSGLMLRVEFQNIQILFHFKTSSDSFRSMIASSWKDSDIPGMKRPSAPPMLFFFFTIHMSRIRHEVMQQLSDHAYALVPRRCITHLHCSSSSAVNPCCLVRLNDNIIQNLQDTCGFEIRGGVRITSEIILLINF